MVISVDAVENFELPASLQTCWAYRRVPSPVIESSVYLPCPSVTQRPQVSQMNYKTLLAPLMIPAPITLSINQTNRNHGQIMIQPTRPAKGREGPHTKGVQTLANPHRRRCQVKWGERSWIKESASACGCIKVPHNTEFNTLARILGGANKQSD